MLLETLDAEEVRADGLFVIPRCSLRPAAEGAKNCRYQIGSFGLACAPGQPLKREEVRGRTPSRGILPNDSNALCALTNIMRHVGRLRAVHWDDAVESSTAAGHHRPDAAAL